MRRKGETNAPLGQSGRLKGFDDYELRLGDRMRGERATKGKSLLDVQRELKIRATYISAIENADASVFETSGFVPGYVRSYARYLGMDPEETYRIFCRESNFSTTDQNKTKTINTGWSQLKKALPKPNRSDVFLGSGPPFSPAETPLLARIQLHAVGTILTMLLLIGGLTIAGWYLLQAVQQVTTSEGPQDPPVLADLDPTAGAYAPLPEAGENGADPTALHSALPPDQPYYNQELDQPVVVARDAPIATLDPRSVGYFKPPPVAPANAVEEPLPAVEEVTPPPQVVVQAPPQSELMAVQRTWVRLNARDGTVILEKTLELGEHFTIPPDAQPTLRAGMSGTLYMKIADQFYGPLGKKGAQIRNLSLAAPHIIETYPIADPQIDPNLASAVAANPDAQSPQSEP